MQLRLENLIIMSICLLKSTQIIFVLFFVLIANNKAEFTASSYLNLKPSFDYAKYSYGLNKHKIPTLENLFQTVTYWDVNNASSPCPHEGRKRSTMCQRVVTFDQSGYDESLKVRLKYFKLKFNSFKFKISLNYPN